MADPIPFDEHSERLKIRKGPRPVTRINRKVLMIGGALGVLGLFAAASVALKPPKAAAPSDRQESFNIKNARRPEGLASLPASYSDLPKQEAPTKDTPKLGPPLPGDLGGTVLQAERELGLEPEYATRFESDFRPNPEDEAARARRMREAALEEEAIRAPVFFRLQSERPPAGIDGRSVDGWRLAGLLAPGAAAEVELHDFGVPDDNLQDRKRAFAREPSSDVVYNPHSVEDPVSPYQVMAGTMIPASLVTGINSDLPGTIIAQVTQPVFDTVTGAHLLIPQGSRLIGRYQSDVSFGQDRALVVWDRIMFPDGSSIQIAEPGADGQGYAGLSDRTDHHWGRVFTAAGLATILGIGSELGAGDEGDIKRAIRRGTSDTLNQAGQRIVDRNLGIQPTLRIRPGWPVRVLVTRDLILRPH